jgi:hypothetical protein
MPIASLQISPPTTPQQWHCRFLLPVVETDSGTRRCRTCSRVSSNERSATRSGIGKGRVSSAPFPEWYCAEGAYRVCEGDSGVHRPVGAGSLERAPSLKILKHHVSYPPHPPAPLPVGARGAELLNYFIPLLSPTRERGAETLLGCRRNVETPGTRCWAFLYLNGHAAAGPYLRYRVRRNVYFFRKRFFRDFSPFLSGSLASRRVWRASTAALSPGEICNACFSWFSALFSIPTSL